MGLGLLSLILLGLDLYWFAWTLAITNLLAVLKNFKVIVSTCGSSSVFSGVGMARGHFSHIFIDEAGQATEPESFLSIKMLADSNTNVILSGDPKQLGPVIRSGIAKELGLETSYLERLMDRDAYDIKTGHGRRY